MLAGSIITNALFVALVVLHAIMAAPGLGALSVAFDLGWVAFTFALYWLLTKEPS